MIKLCMSPARIFLIDMFNKLLGVYTLFKNMIILCYRRVLEVKAKS